MGQTRPSTYVAHPLCAMMPSMSDQEFDALVESIREIGVLSEVELWTDANGDTWKIDGHCRDQAFTQLWAEGVRQTRSGDPLRLPVRHFVGDEMDVLRRVKALAIARRHLRSDQKAAIAIALRRELDAFKADGTSPGARPEHQPVTKEEAAVIAAEYGTNVGYVYQCNTIATTKPEYLPLVSSGEMTIREVVKLIEGLGKKSDKKAESEETPVLDGLGRRVQPHLRQSFATRESFKKIVKSLGKIKREAIDESRKPGGQYLDARDLKLEFNALARVFSESQPFIECPYCQGSGDEEVPDQFERRQCQHCLGRMFLSKAQYDVMDDKTREKIEAGETLSGDSPNGHVANGEVLAVEVIGADFDAEDLPDDMDLPVGG